MKTKIDNTDKLILNELESYRIKKYQLSEGELIHIKVNTFECKLKPENLDNMIKRFKSIINTDFKNTVTRLNNNGYRHNSPSFKTWKLETYCSQNFIN